MQIELFPTFSGRSIRYHRFQEEELGQLRASLPIKELAALLPSTKTDVGAKPWFDNEGKIALQFLKIYEDCSDEKLLARLNRDWGLQLFCGIQLQETECIKDKNLLWQIRKLVSQHLDIDKFQSILIQHWKGDMKNTHIGMSDATCYESYIKYPTDVNLLWDCISWLDKSMRIYCKLLKLRLPRNKFLDHKKKQLNYARRRKKFKKLEKRRRGELLKLLNKILFQFDGVISCWQDQVQKGQSDSCLMLQGDLDKIMLIGKIYEQQRFHYDYPSESVPNRIVSLYKPYLRPIIRGKESSGGKRVEFGAKVNTWQVDGLNFIEHLSFSAFHEGNRLKQGIAFHHKHFGKLRQLGADAIYATNKNRAYVKALNIATCFKPKGRRTINPTIRQQEDVARKTIGSIRATVLEGSYGNDKNHYTLKKVKARTEANEKAWIFFGMMTANAVKIAKRKLAIIAKSKKAKPPEINSEQLNLVA